MCHHPGDEVLDMFLQRSRAASAEHLGSSSKRKTDIFVEVGRNAYELVEGHLRRRSECDGTDDSNNLVLTRTRKCTVRNCL